MSSLQVQDINLNNWDVMAKLESDLSKKIDLIIFCCYHGLSALFVTNDDDVYGIGKNYAGLLGTGSTQHTTLPTKIEILCGKKVTEFACGYYFSLALTAEGEVYAWGDNSLGQLGQGNKTASTLPLIVPSLTKVTQIACGRDHSLAVTKAGEVYAWGNNNHNQCGAVNVAPVLSPTVVQFPAGTAVSSVSCGWVHSAALSSQGRVFCWGYNAHGELGRSSVGANGPSAEAVVNQPSGGFTKVICGVFHTLALTKEGEVFTWGYNQSGVLAVNSTDVARPTPHKISGLQKVTDIWASWTYFLSIAETKTGIYMWGTFGNLAKEGVTLSNAVAGDVLSKPSAILAKNLVTLLENKHTSSIQIKRSSVSSGPITCLEIPQLFDKDDISDLKIIIQDKVIFCHKLVLKKSCPYFMDMLDDRILMVKEYSPQVYYNFIQYIYTKKLEFSDYSALIEMLKIANDYNFEDFKKEIIARCMDNLTVESSVKLYQAAIRYKAMELKKLCTDFMVMNFKKVVNSPDYKTLPGDVAMELTELWAKAT